MEEKDRKNTGGDNVPLDYEGLLNGFGTDDAPEPEPAAPPDLDGLAVDELLGGEPASGNATFIPRYDVAGETGEYAELARQFEDLDLGTVGGNDDGGGAEVPAEGTDDSGDASASVDADEDYTLLLGRLGTEDAPESGAHDGTGTDSGKSVGGRRSGILDFMDLPPLEDGDEPGEPETPIPRKVFGEVNLADDFSSGEELAPPENTDVRLDGVPPDAPEPEPVDAAAVPLPPENPPVILSPEKKPEDDFLGLSGIPGIGAAPKPSPRMETLFEGVEMDFDEQTAQVTLAELLLAQGNSKEAADIFREVANRKGVTNWVANRLRLLSAPAGK